MRNRKPEMEVMKRRLPKHLTTLDPVNEDEGDMVNQMEKLYTADRDEILKTLSPVNLTSKSLANLDKYMGLAKYGKHNPARDIYRGYNN